MIPTNETLQTAAHLSGQSDRYLLIVVLLVFLGGMFWLIRYFISVVNKSEHRLDEKQKGYEESLKKLYQQANETSLKVAVLLDQNTHALQSVKRRLPHE